jgi:hypothetical protein
MGTSGIAGGCRCGAVRYTISMDALPATYACHCLDCQTWSGTAFSQQFPMKEDLLAIEGPLVVYELTSPSGNISRQRMCSVCHTRVYNTNSARPGLVIVRAGTLDRSDELDVVAHIWTKRKQRWIAIPEGIPSWPEVAPANEMAAALAAPRA